MSSHPTTQGIRTAQPTVRMPLWRLLSALVAPIATLALLFVATPAQAAVNPFCLPGGTAGKCNNPNGVATDFETGNVYVADKGNNRVNVFESDGDPLGAIGGGQLTSPSWVAVDNDEASASQGNVWVTTNSSDFLVKKFKPNGEFIEADSFDSASEGEGGKGECEFKANDPIAVGPNGDVYVANSFDKDGPGGANVFVNRVIVFESEGRVCKGEVGGGPLFEENDGTIRNFAVDSTGHIYVTVAGAGGVIRKYSPAGALEHQFEVLETEGVAVDEDDNLFAKQRQERAVGSGLIFAFTQYSPSTPILKRFDYVISQSLNVPALAVYRKGPAPSELHLYASEGASGIRIRTLPPPGPVIVPEPCRVKAGTLGNAKVTLQAEVNPEGKSTTVHYEYISDEDFVENGNSFSGPNLPEETAESDPIGSDFVLHEASVKADVTPETKYHCRVVATNVDGSATGPEGTFTTKPPLEIGETTVSDVGAEEVTLNATVNPLGILATGFFEYVEEATYIKDIEELGPEHGFDHASKAPQGEPIDFGAGEDFKAGSTVLTGLKPGTSYRFRVLATDVKITGSIAGPVEYFRTFGTDTPSLPDDRAWELVSPVEKNFAEVGAPGNRAGFIEPRTITIQAGATDGEAITYTSWTSFGEAEGAPATNQYLSKRTKTGWQTENISPFGFQNYLFFPPYSGFSPDLRFGAFKITEPPLTPDCRKNEGIYLRDNETGALRCLAPEVPGGPEAACLVYAGASQDGSRAFLAGKPAGGENFTYSLYESTPSGVELVSVLPNGEAAPPTEGTAFGPGNFLGVGVGIEQCQVTRTILRHAISADGGRAFWTYVPEERSATVTEVEPGVRTLSIKDAGSGTFTLTFRSQITTPIAFNASAMTVQTALETLSEVGAGNVHVSGSGPFTITFNGPLAGTTDLLTVNPAGLLSNPSQLLVRVNGSETLQLDALPDKGAGKGPAGDGAFWGASADGSVAYFTAEGRLLSGSKAKAGEPNLYRYQLGLSKPLSDLTEGSGPGDVKGVTAISDDGSHVYFVAGGVLAPGAEEGANNLYLNHEGETRFIAKLANQDEGAWSSSPREMSARVSPDGRYLAFLSIEAEELVGYENTIAEGEHCKYVTGGPEGALTLIGSPLCSQAFIYDAEADELTCASCNPSGSRPLGPTVLPNWSNGFEGPRFLSDDGGRLFFQSLDALSSDDENDKLDVYEFERSGEGSCNPAHPGYDPVSEGCHSLLSGGKSSDESYLIDASADGRDVFFSTRRQLVGWDTDETFDVYDAREGGGFPEPSPPAPICEGEGCKPPAGAPPSPASPATPRFHSSGNNVKEVPLRPRCPKGKRRVRKAGKPRCVKPRKSGQRHKGRKG